MTLDEFLRIPFGFMILEAADCRDQTIERHRNIEGLNDRLILEFAVLDGFAVLHATRDWLSKNEPAVLDRETQEAMTVQVVMRVTEHFPELVDYDTAWDVVEERLNAYSEVADGSTEVDGSALGEVAVRMAGQGPAEMGPRVGLIAAETVELAREHIARMTESRTVPDEPRMVTVHSVHENQSLIENPNLIQTAESFVGNASQESLKLPSEVSMALMLAEVEHPECKHRIRQISREIEHLDEKGMFEIAVLDAFVVFSAIRSWMNKTKPELADEAAEVMAGHVAYRVAERFPKLVGPQTVHDLIVSRFDCYVDAAWKGRDHHNGPGWALGKTLAEFMLRDEKVTTVLLGARLYEKRRAVREILGIAPAVPV